MRVERISLSGFRTYQKRIFEFPSDLTVILGPNAVGKTNILEAILICAHGRSFRAFKDTDMIRWNTEIARVEAEIESAEGDTKLGIVLTNGLVGGQKAQVKKFLVNSVPRRQIDFVAHLRAVLFSPTDLELVTDSPGLRRQYMDTILSLTDREYRRNLYSYERGLRQRNSLLSAISDGEANRNQLPFWDQLLIKTGQYISDSRERLLKSVNNFRVSGLQYKVVYDPSRISRERLDQYAEAEIGAHVTLIGPQRDDFHFFMHNGAEGPDLYGADVARFGSRGQQRLAVLWIKLAELNYIEQSVGERPILLLDDIFSELDEESRTIVLSVIPLQQTILTSAEHTIRDQFGTRPGISWIELTV